MAKAKGKVLHPSSRKAKKRMSRKFHEVKIQKRSKLRKSKDELKRKKFTWFKENLPEDRKQLSMDELRSLTARYLDRHKLGSKSEEKEVANCSVSVTIDMTMDLVKQEAHEFETVGLSVPDLTSTVNFEKFKNWNGEVNKMIAIPMTLVKKV